MKYLILIFGALSVAFFILAMPVAVWAFTFDFFAGVNFAKALAHAAFIALDFAIIGLVNLGAAVILNEVWNGYNESGL